MCKVRSFLSGDNDDDEYPLFSAILYNTKAEHYTFHAFIIADRISIVSHVFAMKRVAHTARASCPSRTEENVKG